MGSWSSPKPEHPHLEKVHNLTFPPSFGDFFFSLFFFHVTALGIDPAGAGQAGQAPAGFGATRTESQASPLKPPR